MMRHKWWLTVIALLAIQLSVIGQQTFPLSLSISQFRADSIRTRVEVAYSIADTHLVHQIHSSHPDYAVVAAEIQFFISSPAYSDSLTVVLESTKSIRDTTCALLVGKRVFLLLPDQYTLTVRIRDALRQRSAVLERKIPLVVRSLSERSVLSASSIELAQFIRYHNTDDVEQKNPSFVKNGFYVVPLPSHTYEGTAPILYAYTELYGLEQCRCDSIQLHYRILDAAHNEVFDLRYVRPVVGEAQAEIISTSLDGLASGVYYLTLAVERSTKEELLLGRQQFFLLNPELPPQQPTVLSEDELFLQSPFATMDNAQLEVEIASARFIARATELDPYFQLTDIAAKRRFVFRFWLQRDPDPSTPVNERYEEFRRAREYAAKFYRTPRFPEGWNSDRGRVLLKYGFPTQIDRAYFNMDGAHPHEIWRYDNVQGGVIFVFVDQQGTENFVLVHSTALNEIRNENWYRQFAMPNYLDPNARVR
ncbi:MAG: GWxTD domain-containing protein [Candidatus Kapabacteria bacterium]|nr:GWxTD domain-containing protein [Candidatus Kapabacteria bacterium]MCS7302478.1 GWxTD domain-containing protein [Candidatus Kapabacteria bacterium]